MVPLPGEEVPLTVILRFPSVLGFGGNSDLILRFEDEFDYNLFLENRWLLERAEAVSYLDGLALWVFPEGGDTPLGRETDEIYQMLRQEGLRAGGSLVRPRPV